MITLRPFKKSDVTPLVSILNDAEVTRYLSSKIPSPYTPDDAIWWIEEGSQQGVIRAIEYEGQLVGCIGVNRGEFEYSRSGEIGYWLAKSHWRQGITALAIKQIIHMVFAETDIIRIFGAVFSDNLASRRLLLKCGFVEEAKMAKAIYKTILFMTSLFLHCLKKNTKLNFFQRKIILIRF